MFLFYSSALAEQSVSGDCSHLLGIAILVSYSWHVHFNSFNLFFHVRFFWVNMPEWRLLFGQQNSVSLFPAHWRIAHLAGCGQPCLSGTQLCCYWAILTPAPASGLLSRTSGLPVQSWQWSLISLWAELPSIQGSSLALISLSTVYFGDSSFGASREAEFPWIKLHILSPWVTIYLVG